MWCRVGSCAVSRCFVDVRVRIHPAQSSLPARGWRMFRISKLRQANLELPRMSVDPNILVPTKIITKNLWFQYVVSVCHAEYFFWK